MSHTEIETAAGDTRSRRGPVAIAFFAGFVTCTCALSFAAGASEPSARSSESDELTAAQHLEAAFDRRFGVTLMQNVELTVTSGADEMRRSLTMATKFEDSRVRSFGSILTPAYLRGTRLLLIDNLDRNDDMFVFLPSLGRVRRISIEQRRDAFLGTDLKYRDLERQSISELDVTDRGIDAIDGEPVVVVEARRVDRAEVTCDWYYISLKDHAILEIRRIRDGQEQPETIHRIPRNKLKTFGGYLLPTEIIVENKVRKSRTLVRFSDIRVDIPIDDELFTTTALEFRKHPFTEASGGNFPPRQTLP